MKMVVYVDVVVSRKRVCMCVCEREGECVREREGECVREREINWFYYFELICFTVHRNKKMKLMADTHTYTHMPVNISELRDRFKTITDKNAVTGEKKWQI